MENTQSIAEESFISVFVPIKIKNRGGRGSVSIITPQNKVFPVEEKPSHDFRLINALAKARRLQLKMDQSPNQSISSLATKEGFTHGYMGRLLRLNLLAPDIVEAILDGKQPKDLKIIDFLRTGIPLLWEEQMEKFGFS
ncbi:MAG: hypothetical protein AABY27_06020 [Pseudomonadota bacterium]